MSESTLLDKIFHVIMKCMVETGQAPHYTEAIMIGDLPLAWYTNNDGDFPMDAFFMDLDGTWLDNNPTDGKYDGYASDQFLFHDATFPFPDEFVFMLLLNLRDFACSFIFSF